MNDIPFSTTVDIDYFAGKEGILTPGNAAVALIVLDNNCYLCQLRSQISGIFYPNHWGLFGGGVEEGESPEDGLKRELQEELKLEIDSPKYFTEFSFDFSFRGLGMVWRRYYVVPFDSSKTGMLELGEGSAFKAFTAMEILTQPRVVPYDAFAIWLHATQQIKNPRR